MAKVKDICPHGEKSQEGDILETTEQVPEVTGFLQRLSLVLTLPHVCEGGHNLTLMLPLGGFSHCDKDKKRKKNHKNWKRKFKTVLIHILCDCVLCTIPKNRKTNVRIYNLILQHCWHNAYFQKYTFLSKPWAEKIKMEIRKHFRSE